MPVSVTSIAPGRGQSEWPVVNGSAGCCGFSRAVIFDLWPRVSSSNED